MNNLEKRLYELAKELFVEQGYEGDLLRYKMWELKACVDNDYYSRAELIQLVKMAKVAA